MKEIQKQKKKVSQITFSIENIIDQEKTTRQADTTDFSYSSHYLISLIKKRKLTEALEFLESKSLTEERALFALASLQRGAFQ